MPANFTITSIAKFGSWCLERLGIQKHWVYDINVTKPLNVC